MMRKHLNLLARGETTGIFQLESEGNEKGINRSEAFPF